MIMKKAINCLVLLIVVLATFGQQNNPSLNLPKQDYLQKSKHQKTAAWIMLGGGAILFSVGSILSAHDVVDVFTGQPQNANPVLDDVLAATGAAAMLGSIPLFIASSKNKKKAVSLSLKNELIPKIFKISLVYHNIPSVTLKVAL